MSIRARVGLWFAPSLSFFSFFFFLSFLSFFLLATPAVASAPDPILTSAFQGVIADRSESVVPPYLAISSDRARWFAHAACDDDGDNVIVISQALISLVYDIARSQDAHDKIVAYRDLLRRNPVSANATLPPPAHFFSPATASTESDETAARARSMFVYLFSVELLRFESNTVVCAHPDRTREANDNRWSSSEQRFLDFYVAKESPLIAADGAIVARVRNLSPSLTGAHDLVYLFAEIGAFSINDALTQATLFGARERLSHLAAKNDVRMRPLAR